MAVDPAIGLPPDGLALAIAGANDGLWVWDVASDRLYSSPRLQEIIGQPAQAVETSGRAWLDLIHPDDLDRYRAKLRGFFAGRSMRLKLEYRIRRPDGAVRWLRDRAAAERDETGTVVRMGGSISDITLRRQAEAALRETEARFLDYAETACDWYWETDAQHRFIVHPERIRNYGIDPNTRIGRCRWELADDVQEEPAKWYAHRSLLDRHEPFRDFVYRIRVNDGRMLHVSVSGKPVFDAQGRFTGYRGSGRDISESVNAARKLREASFAAQAANAAKSSFLANMSHELRTPLNAILGFSEIIASELLGPVGNPRYCSYADDIYRSGQHLLDLITDVLDMSKIEAGKLELHEAVVALRPLAEACLPLIRERAAEAGVAIQLDIPADLPRLNADQLRLKQVLLNLLTNAVKFTPRDGAVAVRAAAAPDGTLLIAIADTGIGMTKEEIGLALLPFHQVDGPASKRHEGTGLGLPLAKHLVELHGGSLVIDSAPGKGTTVTVRLPATRVLAERPAA